MDSLFARLAASRRSIRKYQDRAVEPEKIAACVEAVRLAPSACNGQPWKLVVLEDAAARARFCSEVLSGMYSMTSFAGKAPALVALVSEKPTLPAWIGDKIQSTSFVLKDIGIACAHFALQAHDLGLGVCIIGWFNRERAAELLRVPGGRRVELLFSVGYPAESPAPRPRKKLNEMCSRNYY